jgi:hypothetical protein
MLLRPLSLLAVAALTLIAACNKDEVKPDEGPRLGTLELPTSHRLGDSEPSGAARIEITPAAMFVDGEQVVPLENGKIPAAERSGYEVPKLKAKLSGKGAAALSVYAAVPYATLARAMHTALAAGASELAFKVRKPNSNTQTGWLSVKKNRFVPSSEDGQFSESELVPWDSFAKVWEESLAACQMSTRADCGYRPMAKAEGGKLDLMLRVRGSGLALRFRQAGAPAVADAGVASADASATGAKVASKDKKKGKKKRGAEMLDGIKAAPVAEEAPPEPATEHVFTLRTDQATADPSPISGITKPVCSGTSCPVVLDAEGISMSIHVLSLLGAAFPDGTPAPTVAWVLPPKD